MTDKKATPLWKALILEHRLPWRYKAPFKPIKDKLIRFFHLNVNSNKYWDRIFSNPRKQIGNENYYELMKFLPKKKFSLLDIGSGLGEGCILIKKRFPKAKIEGCDFSRVALSKSKVKTKDIDFFELDIRKDEIPKKYDYIISISVFEHFRKPEEIIKKCLKHANTLILDCPYEDYGIEHLFQCKEDTFKEFNPKVKRKGDRITYIIRN